MNRFLYNASALALGGRMTRPFAEVIEAQAATMLPVTGGYGSARVDKFCYRDLISFESAYSTVVGNEGDDGTVNTLATVTIEGLNLMGVITADLVVGRLVSAYTGGDELPAHPGGSHFVNLRVGGVEVRANPRQDFLTCHRLSDVKKAHEAAVLKDGSILSTVFEGQGCKGSVPSGIEVPDFGRVYLAEYHAAPRSRRLTMIRVEMGSPIRGVLALGDMGGNGSTYP
jgi:hypothetical protein